MGRDGDYLEQRKQAQAHDDPNPWSELFSEKGGLARPGLKQKDSGGHDKPDGDKSQEKKSPDEITHDFERDAYSSLRAAHKQLSLTLDKKEPRELVPVEKRVLGSEKTAKEIAKEVLGVNAADAQVKFYAESLREVNGLKGDLEAKIPAGTELTLLGQRKDGGLYIGKQSAINWSDGSRLSYARDGAILANYTDRDGYSVRTVINALDPGLSERAREKGEQRAVEDSSGKISRFEKASRDPSKDDWQKTSVEYSDEKGRKIIERYTPERSPEASSLTVVFPDKSVIDAKLGSDGEYHGAKKDRGGKVVDSDVGVTADGSIYSRKFVEGPGKEKLEVKTFTGDGGLVKTIRESDGQTLKEESTDSFGRKHIALYEEGNVKSLEVVPKQGPRITLNRDDAGNLKGDWIAADGKTKIGSVESGPEGQLIFKSPAEARSRIEYKDGKIESLSALPNGGRRTVREEENEKVTVDTDLFGTTRKVFEYENGLKMEMSDFVDKKAQKIHMEDEDKSKTELSFDSKEGVYKGVRKDASGKIVEDATFDGENLLFKDRATGSVRADVFEKHQPDDFRPPAFRSGDYDHHLATLTIVDSEKGTEETVDLSGGRTDLLTRSGAIKGTTDTGRVSENNPDGSAFVRYRDGSGGRLDADGKTITLITGGFDGRSTRESLSKSESDFLKAHDDVDRRDVIEIHRRYAGSPETLEKIYSGLKSIDTAKNLSDDEKSALRRNLMQHVGSPAEISQNASPTCAVTVTQRSISVTQPDRYIKQVVSAVSEGKVTCAGGETVDVDPAKMKMLDSSGRDLATRIFQNSAISALYHPRFQFEPTEDGTGRLYKMPRQTGDKPGSFEGLRSEAITELEYKLSGVDKTVVKVDTLDDLMTAFKLNGGRPMTVGVDTNKPPFSDAEPNTAEPGGHVITVVGFTDTEPPRVLFANQWGLHADHSEPHRSVDAEVFMKNLRSESSIRVDGKHVGLGEVIVSGDRKKAFRIRQGSMVEDPLATAALSKWRKKEFGE